MKIFYSKKYNGFFNESFGELPKYCIEISPEQHEEFLSGKKDDEMKPGDDGKPSWSKMVKE